MLPSFEQQSNPLDSGISKRTVVAHAHAIRVAAVNDDLRRRLQRLRKINVALQRAGNQQRRASLVHGMQVKQMRSAGQEWQKFAGAIQFNSQLCRLPA